MFRKILLPLDGSDLAQGILPYVSQIARAFDSTVLALTAIEDPAEEANTLDALEAVAGRLRERDIAAEVAVAHGPAAEGILNTAAAERCNLIAMSTHGRTGLVRAVLGSVTERVIRTPGPPTLAISPERASQYEDGGRRISNVILPLDGTEEAEIALPYARDVAVQMSLDVIMVRVTRGAIHTPVSAALLETAGVDVDAEIDAQDDEYLRDMSGPLIDRGLKVDTKVLHGAPSFALAELARETSGDLIVIASHGRSGLRRITEGSVAEALVRSSGDPVLVIPQV